MSLKKATDFCKKIVKTIKEYDEEMIHEIRGIAEGSGRSIGEIMILNLRTRSIRESETEGGGMAPPSAPCRK